MKRFAAPLIALLLGLSPILDAAGKGEQEPAFAARVELTDREAALDLFRTMDLDVDGVFDGWARLYLTQEEMDKLGRLGFVAWRLPLPTPPREPSPQPANEGGPRSIPTTYHTYDTLTAELNAIATARPDLVRLISLGTSAALPPDPVRQLWMMKISDNPDVEEDEPEVAYVAAIHGDEVVGKELCIELIHHLLDNYGTDPRVTALVDETEIWIMPSMNPDGTAAAQRYNYNGFDLNRNFPDWFSDPVNSTAGRQPETQAVMNWVAAHSINLSANFHGGALLANYPWDNNDTGSSVFSPTPDPDQPMFHSISLTYAQNNPPMFASPSFTDGVTNGAAWYAIDGGMQDWSYAWYGKYDVTMEISDVKWPPGSELPTFWNENRESMLSYFERAHEGLRGIVSDAATGAPVAAEVRLDANPFAVRTDPDVGDYHRIVLPGSYTLHVSAPGYDPMSMPVTVAAGPAATYDVALQPLPADLQPVTLRIDSEPSGDGWVDPGETVDLALTLRNQGNLATGIGGRLIPTGWFADVVQADATWPDLGNQAQAESNGPYYAVEVAPGTPAGHKIGFAVEWTAAQGSGVSEPIFLPLGGTTCSVTGAADVPQAILDYQTLTSDVTIVGGAEIDEVRVLVDIGHTFIGDLEVELTAPSGAHALLHDRSGGGTDNIVGTYGVDLSPAEPLSTFAGLSSAGTWTLRVSDLAGGDQGNLNDWSLEVCGRPVEAATPEMRFREVTREPGGTLLRWWSYPGVTEYRVYRSAEPGTAAAFVDVTAEDPDDTDTLFQDTSGGPLAFFLVTGVGPQGEGSKGHFGQ